MARVFLDVGSNSDRERHILNGLIDINEHFNWVQRSQVYESEAVGFAGHAFYNLVVEVTTTLDVESVLQQCKAIEKAHGRTHGGLNLVPVRWISTYCYTMTWFANQSLNYRVLKF